ncbi:MAG: hypothetical protein QCI00_08525, partial [Candidatus Thermoplasmatota archaeon]|nr:hypothetical protein [Candidatus Thermoplasmatota archaeon]
MNQIKGSCTYLKMNLILFLMLLFLILFIPYTTAIDNSKIFPNISYGSKIDLTYNTSLIEEYLPLEKKVTVPITIKYYTFINDNIHRYLPDFIANKFLFNSFSAPQQKIKFSIINPPSYGTFSIDPDSVSLNIPIGNEISTKTVDLIITLSKDAPSVPYSLQIACNVSSLGRLNGCSSYIDIPFTPKYTPCITVDGVDSVIVKAKETTNVYVNVTNCGNRASRVYARLLTVSDDLAIFIPQSHASLE